MDKKITAEEFIKLIEIVEILRGPDGCPWDKNQTNESLLPYLLEEAYELIESVDTKDWETFKEELGDVMLHVVLQAQITKENIGFDLFDFINNNFESLGIIHGQIGQYFSVELNIIGFYFSHKLAIGHTISSSTSINTFNP